MAFRNKGAKAATELDFIGEIRDARGKQASVVRDTIPVKVASTTAGEVTRKQIQYDTGFTLGPGKYTLKFVARENGEGQDRHVRIALCGSGSGFGKRDAPEFGDPEQSGAGGEGTDRGRQERKKLVAEDPLIDESGEKIMPNVTRVFRPGQKMSMYLELYDPGTMQFPATGASADPGRGDRQRDGYRGVLSGR